MADGMPKQRGNPKWAAGFGIGSTAVFVTAVALVGWDAWDLATRKHSWLIWMVLLASLLILVSALNYWWGGRRLITKGLLVDANSRVSLARFQTAVWTLLLVSAIAAAIALNQGRQVTEPWDIKIPNEILVVAGISLTALTAAGIIKQDGRSETPDPKKMLQAGWESPARKRGITAVDQPEQWVPRGSQPAAQVDAEAAWERADWAAEEAKRAQAAAEDATNKAAPDAATKQTDAETAWKRADQATADAKKAQAAAEDAPPADFCSVGTIAGRCGPEDASWWDLFVSDAAVNLDRLEVSRFQEVVVTSALVVAYGVQFAMNLRSGGKAEFPPFDEALVILLAISNSAFVAVKTANLKAAEQ
jgi:hypothetical protein